LFGAFQSLVEFFGTLSKEWALECMKDLLLVNLRGNLQIIVQVNYCFFQPVLLSVVFLNMRLTRIFLYRLPKNTLSSWVLMHA